MTISLSNIQSELDEFLVDRVQLMAKEAFRTPLPVLAIAGLAFYAAQKNIRFELPLIWIICVAVCLGLRTHTAYLFLRQRLSAKQAHSRFVGFALANGLIMGIGFTVFMGIFNIEWQALVTMFAVCLAAASIPSTAINAKTFGAFALPGLSLLAYAWVFFGRLEHPILNWLCALILVAFSLISYGFVRDHENKLRDSFHTQQENQRLLERLQHNQNELVDQRDKAQSASLEKTRVLAAASHDLRQPLHALSLYHATLALRPLDQRSRWLVEQSGIALESMSTLLNSLLDLSRAESPLKPPQLKPIRVQELLRRLSAEFAVLAQKTGVQIVVNCEAHLVVYSDVVMLERILRNLIDNALKHGAKSVVKLNALAPENSSLAQGHVHLQIVDDGPGINFEQRELVFEEFFQANNPERDRSKGLGLGLAIVRRFCEQLQISCTLSATNLGTIFNLAVPRFENTETDKSLFGESDQTALAEAMPLKSPSEFLGRVLVVDSSEGVRSSTCALIEAFGFDVKGSDTIANALLELNRVEYAALVADAQMADGPGLQLLMNDCVKSMTIKKVYVSGALDRDLIQQARLAGAELLIKPVAVQAWKAALCG